MNYVKDYQENGYAIIKDFLSDDEVNALKNECREIVDCMDPKEHSTTFESGASHRKDYFVNSTNNISFFFEKDAFGENGKLAVDKHNSLNKIGHALHVLNPIFKRITFSDKVKDICKNLSYKDPKICQSMYIFKPPNIGGVVNMHQDGTYLQTNPLKIFGLWIALEDANIENSCLWFIPKSHKEGLIGDWRMIRKVVDGQITTSYVGNGGQEPDYSKYGDFVPEPVKKGSLVIIDGLVIHKSEPNLSDSSRHIYTFHVFDAGSSTWDEENWSQPTKEKPYLSVYSTV